MYNQAIYLKKNKVIICKNELFFVFYEFIYQVTGLQIFFIFDKEYCKDETDENGIVYFNPSHITQEQKDVLCGQLMGTFQFLFTCFSPPKLINMQKGKFAMKQENSFVMALGGSKDMPDCVLLRQMQALQELYRFYYKSITSAKKSSANRNEFSDKMKNRWDCCLRMSQHGGNALNLTFSAVPTINLRHDSGKSVLQSSLDLLQSCQKKSGVIAGVIIYKNKVLTSQFNPNFTYMLLMNQCAQRDKFKPEEAKINGRVPPGIRLLQVYLVDEEVAEISSLNRYHTSRRRVSGGGFKYKNKKRPDLRNIFPEAQSSDELSTVTEESIESSHSRRQSISSTPPDLNAEQDRLRQDSADNCMGYLNSAFYGGFSDDDSGQSEKSEYKNETTLGDSAFSAFRDVAKKSFISANNKFRKEESSKLISDKVSSVKRSFKKSRSHSEGDYPHLDMNENEVQIKNIPRRKPGGITNSAGFAKSTDDSTLETDAASTLKLLKEKSSLQIRRSKSETTISISQKLKNKSAEVMSEDSSYYSNEPSPTIGRKHWKNESDLSNSDSVPQWQDMVGNAVKSFKEIEEPLQNPIDDEVEIAMELPIKPPLRRKLSTIVGPQTQRTAFPKSFVLNYAKVNNSVSVSQISGITGNNISDKVSWSSSGYETALSCDNDKEFKSFAQHLSVKDNPQMLPNGKIVPVELKLLPATLKKERNDNPASNPSIEKTLSQTNSVSSDITDSSTSSDDKRVSEESDNDGHHHDQSQYKPAVKTSPLTLYVQSHSNINLLLLLNDTACSESIIHSLWRIGLSCLGDISVDVHRFMDSSSKKEQRHNHKYLRFNTENHTLSGDSLPLNPKETSDRILGRVTQLIHEDFQKEETITDLTIALRDTMIHGHSTDKKETYYQQSRLSEMPPQQPHGGARPKRVTKRLESNFGSFLL
ncbi:Hermansky-Pudlak syndrome 4 protein [Nymphon striatum]|nr:Hermansky-Pudlak syndrome 4 protein [Nymphon striatum]